MLITSPTGFGKTMSSLLLAYGITNDWSKICVIDTENDSAQLYSHLGPYNVITMKAPYTVDDFVKAMKICADAGIEVVISDSVTHYWDEVKAYVDRLGSGFQNWAKGTPVWSRLVNTILQSPMHVICTARKKQAYDMVKKDGKTVVEKKGLESQIRDGFDYEMTLVFDLINDQHLAQTSKDRTGLFMNSMEFVINEKTGEAIKNWCESGAEVLEEPTEQPAQSAPPMQAAPVKPILTDKGLTASLQRIKKGETDLYERMKIGMTMTPEQEKILLAAVGIENSKKANIEPIIDDSKDPF
jgi:hypothetical protein